MSRYRETLNRWAQQHVPDGARVTSVDITYDDGWDPTFTPGDPSLSVYINYTPAGSQYHAGMSTETAEVLSGIGELLTELFAIEDESA